MNEALGQAQAAPEAPAPADPAPADPEAPAQAPAITEEADLQIHLPVYV